MPAKFDLMIQSWDLSFKGEVAHDFVVGQVWGRVGVNCYGDVEHNGVALRRQDLGALHRSAHGVHERARDYGPANLPGAGQGEAMTAYRGTRLPKLLNLPDDLSQRPQEQQQQFQQPGILFWIASGFNLQRIIFH